MIVNERRGYCWRASRCRASRLRGLIGNEEEVCSRDIEHFTPSLILFLSGHMGGLDFSAPF